MASSHALSISLIVSEIFQVLKHNLSPNHTLAQCARVCRLWNEEACRLLYKAIVIRNTISSWDCSGPDRIVNPLNAIHPQRRQRVAAYVQRVKFEFVPTPYELYTPETAEIVAGLLFPGVRTVSITIEQPMWDHPKEALWEDPSGSGRPEPSTAALAALLSSPNLTSLEFHGPKAVSYTVSSLRLHSTSLAQCLCRLEVLCFQGTPCSELGQLKLLDHCSRLKSLEFYTSVTLPSRDEDLHATLTMFFDLPSVEVFRIRHIETFPRSSLPIARKSEHDERLGSVSIREVWLEAPVNLTELVLKRLNLPVLTILNLRIRMPLTEPLTLQFLQTPRFSNLRHVSVSFLPDPLSGSNSRWTVTSEDLLAVARNCPGLVYIACGALIDTAYLRVNLDDDIFSRLGKLLPSLEHLEIKGDDQHSSVTATGLLDLGRYCRRLSHFDVAGQVDITDPAFFDALHESKPYMSQTEPDWPYFPYLRTLGLTRRPCHPNLSLQYPDQRYSRAPPETIDQFLRLIRTEFPSMAILSRARTSHHSHAGPMQVRRKKTNGAWPRNRLSHFMAPWYSRVDDAQALWKFEANPASPHGGWGGQEGRESDSNSDIDLDEWHNWTLSDDDVYDEEAKKNHEHGRCGGWGWRWCEPDDEDADEVVGDSD